MRKPRLTLADKRYPSNPGDKVQIILSPSFLPDGSIHLQPSDKVDIQAEINSHRSECDMSLILARIAAGDTSMLRTDVKYGDFTKLPKTMPEAFDLVSRADAAFAKLKPEVRHLFNDDVGQWFAQAGSEAWYKAMSEYFPVPDPPAVSSSAGSEPMKEA